MPFADLFDPPDIIDANREWKANCGPCALAALLGLTVEGVRAYFPAFPSRPWTNPTQMKAAIVAAGRTWKDTLREYNTRFPLFGLAFVQLEGPWLAEGVPIAAAYKQTHWVAMSGGRVYDANAGTWLLDSEWQRDVMPEVVEHYKRATGWHVRSGLEVK